MFKANAIIMRKSLFILMFLAVLGISNAQTTSPMVAEGEIVLLGEPSSSDYNHIDFPRKNIIIKRGAIADFSNLVGKKIIVEKVTQKENGITEVVLKRKDGLKFFRFYPRVKADFDQAISSGELKRTKSKQMRSIASR